MAHANPSDAELTRLLTEARTIAILHDRALSDEPELLRSVAATARIALENERLRAEIRAQLQEVRDSRQRIVEAGDEVVVTYESTRPDGSRFRNTEVLTFEGDKIRKAEVYFGWNLE